MGKGGEMSAHTPTHTAPGGAEMTIRVQKEAGGPWLPVELLELSPGWVRVDDGLGRLWVMLDHVHPDDVRSLFSQENSAGTDVLKNEGD